MLIPGNTHTFLDFYLKLYRCVIQHKKSLNHSLTVISHYSVSVWKYLILYFFHIFIDSSFKVPTSLANIIEINTILQFTDIFSSQFCFSSPKTICISSNQRAQFLSLFPFYINLAVQNFFISSVIFSSREICKN